MNVGYAAILAASEDDRRGLFAATARRIGTTEQNVEKDFWTCWALDALFHQMPPGGPRLLFKGGTSLSKAFSLIQRFSEDIDIAVFRADLGLSAPPEKLETLSGKKRQSWLDAIRNGCRQYIQDSLRLQLEDILAATMKAAGIRRGDAGVMLDDSDSDGQTVLVRYPSVVTARDSYVRPSIKIEAGAKSALDPHVVAAISPFVAADVPGTFALLPTPAMRKGLEGDYARMAGMIFGSIPPFDEVMASVDRLESMLN